MVGATSAPLLTPAFVYAGMELNRLTVTRMPFSCVPFRLQIACWASANTGMVAIPGGY